jgi:mersacidin/lichenicidin family type 2 lantibiotic
MAHPWWLRSTPVSITNGASPLHPVGLYPQELHDRRKNVNTEIIIRAWKDPEFRASLSPAQRQALPECPSGRPLSELDEEDLVDVVGGALIIRPTPPLYFTKALCTTRGSAIDACPSALGCTILTIREHVLEGF